MKKNPQNHNKKIRKFVVVQNDYAGTLAQLNYKANHGKLMQSRASFFSEIAISGIVWSGEVTLCIKFCGNVSILGQDTAKNVNFLVWLGT